MNEKLAAHPGSGRFETTCMAARLHTISRLIWRALLGGRVSGQRGEVVVFARQ